MKVLPAGLPTAFATALLCAHVAAQTTTTRVSVDSSGAQADGDSYYPAISDDGRHVAFHSRAANLVPGDTNVRDDIFVHDRQTGAIERVSVTSGGAQANSTSNFPALSADGRYVAFHSYASNLVVNDTNGVADIFVHDRQTGTTERVSSSSSGAQANGDCNHPSISGDGRYVAFAAQASNLIAGDTNAAVDVFVRDRQTGTTERVSIDSSGAQANAYTLSASISNDGRYVAFHGLASNLVPGDTNSAFDVFVRDRQAGTTTRVSIDSSGIEGNGSSYGAVVSADGSHVAFYSHASNLEPGDANSASDVFVRGPLGTERLSVSSGGIEGNSPSDSPSISADGNVVAFHSHASNLVPFDTNSTVDVFVRNRQSGTTVRISVDTAGVEGDRASVSPSISDDGDEIAFHSSATNLVAGDSNDVPDVFVLDHFLPPTVYCTAGTTSHGCVSSISGTGTPSASAGSGFTIAASSVEGQKQGLLFYGIHNSGFTPTSWGTTSSFLCVKSPTQRTSPQSSGGSFNQCDGTLSLDWNVFISANPAALGNPFHAGQHVFAQGWFRDPPSPKTTMLTDALKFEVGP